MKCIGQTGLPSDGFLHMHVWSDMQVKDLLKGYPAFQRYSRNGLDLSLEYFWADNAPKEFQGWAFNLCKANMEDIYNTAWGWSDDTKREELAAPEARFLVAYQKVLIHAQYWQLSNVQHLLYILHACGNCIGS